MTAVDTHTGEIIESLTDVERDAWRENDTFVRDNVKSFVETGARLLVIRDSRQYREDFPTFEAYCADVGLDKRYASRIIEASETVRALGPMGPTITSERQARALAPIIRDHGAETAAEVLRTTTEQTTKVTAKSITETAAGLGLAPTKPAPKPALVIPGDPPPTADENARAWRLKLRDRVGESIACMQTPMHPNNIADTLAGIAEFADRPGFNFTIADLRNLADQAHDLADLLEKQ